MLDLYSVLLFGRDRAAASGKQLLVKTKHRQKPHVFQRTFMGGIQFMLRAVLTGYTVSFTHRCVGPSE